MIVDFNRRDYLHRNVKCVTSSEGFFPFNTGVVGHFGKPFVSPLD